MEARDPGHLHAGAELELVAGDGRARPPCRRASSPRRAGRGPARGCDRTASTAALSTSWASARCSSVGGRQLPRRALDGRAELDLELGGLDRLVGLGHEHLRLAGPGLAAGRSRVGVVEVDEVVDVLVEEVHAGLVVVLGTGAQGEEVRADALAGCRRWRRRRDGWRPRCVSAATRTGTRVSTTRPPMPMAVEDQARAPGREAGGERTGGRHAEQAAGGDEVLGGRVEPGAAAGEVEQAAAGDGDHQPADPEVGAGAGRRPRRPRASGAPRTSTTPKADEGDRDDAAGPTRRSCRCAVSRPRPTGPATSAYTPIPATMPRVMHSRPSRSPEWPPSAEASPLTMPVDEGGRRGRGVPLLHRRALGPPAAGPLGRSHSAHNRTSSPTSNTGQHARASPVSGAAGRWGSGWCPVASMTLRTSSRAAAVTRLAGPAVAAELELVAAGLTLHGAVVTQRGAAVGDALLEDGSQLDEERVGLAPGDDAAGGVDRRRARAPRRRRCCRRRPADAARGAGS